MHNRSPYRLHGKPRLTRRVQKVGQRRQDIRDKYLREYLDFLRQSQKSTRNELSCLPQYFDYLDLNNLDWGRVRIAEAQDYQMYLLSMIKSDGSPCYQKTTVARMIANISSFYIYLKDRHLVQYNPFSEIRRLKAPRNLPRHIPNEEDTGKLLAHLREFWKEPTLRDRRCLYRAHVMAEVLYATGVRINELLNMRLSDVDLERRCIRIMDRKGGRMRECLLNTYATAVLKLYIEEMRYSVVMPFQERDKQSLFGGITNPPFWLNKLLHRESRAIGVTEFTCHRFRHAIATHFLRAGCDIRYIQELLGHRAISSTQVYTEVDKHDLQRVLDQFHPRMWRHEK